MRIALVVPGGVNRAGEYKVIPVLLWLVERLARRHDVQVVSLRHEPDPASWDRLGARVHNIGERGGRTAAVRTLLRLHRAEPFDVFHAMWAGAPGQTALVAARLCRRPVIVHVAGGELVSMPEVGFGPRRARGRAAVRFVVRHADRVTAASGPMLELVRQTGVEPVRIPLGVDTARWRPEPPRPRAEDRPARLVQVASLRPVKDQATLLRAVALLAQSGQPVRADLIGNDTTDGAVHRTARELGVERYVTLHGFLPQRRTIPIVRAADLMVVTSRHEAGPVAMLEAAAVGVPTVGTPVGHLTDWAPDAAREVPMADPEALAAAIEELLHDDSHRLAVARRAQRLALQESADFTYARFEELYRELADDGAGAGAGR